MERMTKWRSAGKGYFWRWWRWNWWLVPYPAAWLVWIGTEKINAKLFFLFNFLWEHGIETSPIPKLIRLLHRLNHAAFWLLKKNWGETPAQTGGEKL